jgi:hypothetical protein
VLPTAHTARAVCLLVSRFFYARWVHTPSVQKKLQVHSYARLEVNASGKIDPGVRPRGRNQGSGELPGIQRLGCRLLQKKAFPDLIAAHERLR